MATLLRLALGVLVMAYLIAVALVFALTTDSAPRSVSMLWLLTATLVGVPPMVLGSLVGYWSGFDVRRMRRMVLVSLAVQVAGVIGMVVTGSAADIPVLATAVLALVGLTLLPALLALGRAAREAEGRRPQPTPPVPDELDRLVRRAWRRTIVGALVGVVPAAAFVGWLGLNDTDGSVDAILLAGVAVSIVCFAALVGLFTLLFRVVRVMRETSGGDYETARHLTRVVTGKAEPRTDEERRASTSWAVGQLRYLPLQLTQSALLFCALGATQLGQLGVGGLTTMRVVLLAAIALLLVALVVATVVQVRRLRAYVAAHPVPDATAGEPAAEPATEPD